MEPPAPAHLLARFTATVPPPSSTEYGPRLVLPPELWRHIVEDLLRRCMRDEPVDWRTPQRVGRVCRALDYAMRVQNPAWFEMVGYARQVARGTLRLVNMPPRLRTPLVCMAAITEDPHNIGFVPAPTEELCLWALRQGGTAIRYVHDPSASLCWAAVEQDPEALDDVPDALQTERLCYEALRRDGRAIRHIRGTPVTDTMQLLAVRTSPEAIMDIIEVMDPSDAVIRRCLRTFWYRYLAKRTASLDAIFTDLRTTWYRQVPSYVTSTLRHLHARQQHRPGDGAGNHWLDRPEDLVALLQQVVGDITRDDSEEDSYEDEIAVMFDDM